MDTTTTLTLFGTLVAAIGGKEAWSYYRKRLEVKAKLLTHGAAGEVELRNEIKEMFVMQIADLKEQIVKLTARIKHLEEEREEDKKRIANQEIKITLLSERLGKKLSSSGRSKKNKGLSDDDSSMVD